MIKTKISHLEACDLIQAYAVVITDLRNKKSTIWEDLIFEHFVFFYYRLVDLAKHQRKSYRLRLSDPEALAFLQGWDAISLDDDYIRAQMIIYRIIAEIDQVNKNTRVLLQLAN